MSVIVQAPTAHAFFAVSWLALAGLVAAVGALGWRLGGARRATLAAAFCVASFGVAYGATAGVRADPLLLVAVAAAVTVGRSRGGGALAAVAVAGVLAHEMALFGLVALGVERATGARLFGREAPRASWRALGAAAACAVAVLVAVRLATDALPASQSNWADTSPLRMAAHALRYGGGPVLYAGRVYAAFGPAALFALAALVSRRRREQLAAAGLVATAALLTFLATDTLRVMAIAGVVVLPLAAAFVDRLLARRLPALAALAVVTQALFSAVVYGHLRTVEASGALQVAAAALSVVALGVAVAGGVLERRFPPLFNAPRGRRTPRAVNVSLFTTPETWQAPTTSSSSVPAPAATRPPSAPISSA